MRRKLLIGAGLLVLFLVGVGIGAAGSEETEGSAVRTTTVTETVEADPVTVERTPESCIRALDLASEGFNLVGEVGAAVESLDPEAMERSGTRLEQWADRNGDEISAATQDCRSSAE